jgi:phage replication-related protein YjqB (UPF0714/DUF867 family)
MADLSYYLFEGCLPTAHESQVLHITSRKFDEPKCLDLIKEFQNSLAIHGCLGRVPIIYIGGIDVDLKDKMLTELSQKGYPTKAGTGNYAGNNPTNICNRTSMNKGVQLEISNGFRRLLFEDWRNRKGRKTSTELFARFVSDIRELIV